MAKRPVRLSARAELWLLSYITELAGQDPQAAKNILGRLEGVKELLSDFPQMAARGALPGTRKVVMRPLILTVRVKNNVLEIAAIRHERQRPPRQS